MNPYITTAEIEGYLGESASGTTKYDSLCIALSNSLDARVNRFRGGRLYNHTESVSIDTKTGRKVYCPFITPIVSFQSKGLYERGQYVSDYDGFIYVYKDHIKLEYSLPSIPQYLRIVCISGFFEESNIDPMIKEFLLKYAATAIRYKQKAMSANISNGTLTGDGGFDIGDFTVKGSTSGGANDIISDSVLKEDGIGLILSNIVQKYGRPLVIGNF